MSCLRAQEDGDRQTSYPRTASVDGRITRMERAYSD